MFKFVSTKNINELFQRAILQNDIQRTKLILEEAMKDPRFNIDQINEEGLTALQFSCFAGNVEIVKVLTAYGANWKIRDRDGYTLMHAAAMAGNGMVLRFLLQMGLRPVLKTDEGMLPIDMTDEISIIVILLRAMLDQGFLQEMQDYMMDHPKLKRNIFKELEKVKCREQEKMEILNEMPYTSHTLPLKKSQETKKKSKTRDGHSRRSTSTFSELSDSIQQLDKLDSSTCPDVNNNECEESVPFSQVPSDLNPRASDTDTDTLKRDNSFSSNSSHSSKSSYRSGSGGILRHNKRQDVNDADNAYKNTQQYLESRFPSTNARPKSVSFDFNGEAIDERRYSECLPNDSYCERTISSQLPFSTANNVSNSNPVESLDEPLYENAVNARMRAKISDTDNTNKAILQASQKQIPPPLPPRAPTTQLSDGLRLKHISYDNNSNGSKNSTTHNRIYEDNYISDRQLGSETDSGIDVNETAGRMFALSVNDRRDDDNFDRTTSTRGEKYSSRAAYYLEEYKGSLSRQHRQGNIEPCSFAIKKNYDNPKYRSWNGRSFHDSDPRPYNNHYRNTSTTFDNFYDTRYVKSPSANSREPTTLTISAPKKDYPSAPVRKKIESNDFSMFDFDNQPEIML